MASSGGNEDSIQNFELTEDQINQLEDNFIRNKHPNETSLIIISAECGLSEEETTKWFQKRNAQWREAEGLPAKKGSVMD
ncbi:hypothetical protein GJAV_G00246140 [Gymnothorax javanicus]|nr:hypothetical protein GJAV_G00246140 [Gymnothorax javanicus]